VNLDPYGFVGQCRVVSDTGHGVPLAIGLCPEERAIRNAGFLAGPGTAAPEARKT